MQEPSWADVFAYLLERLQKPHSLWFWEVLLVPPLSIIWVGVSLLWQRHLQHQRVACVKVVFERWIQRQDKPLGEMSSDEQLIALDRLGEDLFGHPIVVLQFLVALRVAMESWHAQERVLVAIDGLAQTWHHKVPSERKRRARRAQVLARRDVDRLLSRIERDGVRSAHSP